MLCRRGEANASQEAAFVHADVVEIVAGLIEYPDLGLMKLARDAVLFRATPDAKTLDGLIGATRISDELRLIGRRIAEAGMRIAADATDPEFRNRKRGAVLERLTYELVHKRDARAEREQQVRLTGRRWSTPPRGGSPDWSKPKDVTLDTGHAAFEVYEAKFAATLEQDDLDELADIITTARSEGTVPFAVLTTMQSDRSLFARLRLLEPRDALYYAADQHLLDLGKARPFLTV